MNNALAVIGGGYWGKNLIRNFHALGALGLVCDKNTDLLQAHARQYPGLCTSTSMLDAFSSPDIRAVAVATPAETHWAIAREALKAGKHVFVEKPLALDPAEAEDLTRLAAERGLTLMAGHLMQYHPAFLRLLDMARKGELGRINYIYSHRLNLGRIRREENILWSFAPHDISMILALLDAEPDEVSCQGGCFLHKKIADVTVSHMAFPSGAQAHIFVSWLHPFKEQKLVVVGDRQMAVFDDGQGWDAKLMLYPHTIRWEGQCPVPDKAAGQPVAVDQGEPLRAECEHFLACVEQGLPPRTDGAESVRVLRVLNAAQTALDTGHSVRLRPAAEEAAEETGEAKPDWTAHETAVIDPGVSVGAGTRIWHFAHLLPGTRVGEGCTIGQNVALGPDVTVGRGCKIQNNVSVFKGVTLEDGVFCGPSMVFTNVYNPRAHISRRDEFRPTLVMRGATLGANCTIVCGVTIGRYAFVGAGAVVTRDVPDHALITGNPGRRSGWMCRCGEKLPESLLCPVCGDAYVQAEGGLRLRQQPDPTSQTRQAD